MSLIRSIIDGNEAAEAYCRYMRPARRDNDKMPQRKIVDLERAGYVKDLNNYLDRVQVGYVAVASDPEADLCEKCHKPLPALRRHVKSIYTRQGRIDLFRCANC